MAQPHLRHGTGTGTQLQPAQALSNSQADILSYRQAQALSYSQTGTGIGTQLQPGRQAGSYSQAGR